MTLDHDLPGDTGHDDGSADDATPLPLLAAGVLAGVGAAALGLVLIGLPVFGSWLLSPESDIPWSGMLRTVGGGWLAAQAVPVVVDGVTITLLPWGLGLVCVGLLVMAGRWAARASAVGRPAELLAVAIPAAVVYAVVVTGVAGLLGAPPGRALLSGLVIALVSVLVGGTRGSTVALRIPPGPRRILAASGVALAVLIAAGALVAAAAVVVRSAEVAAVIQALAPDAAGAVVLTLVSLGFVPVLVVWGLSYVLGIGFTLGLGVAVSPFAADPAGAIPALPLLAAVPDQVPIGAQALPVVGILAGVLAGILLRRSGSTGLRGALEAVAAAAGTGAAVGLLAWLSAGALGVDRLAHVGPDAGLTALAALVLTLLGAVAVVIPPAPDDPEPSPVDLEDLRPTRRSRTASGRARRG